MFYVSPLHWVGLFTIFFHSARPMWLLHHTCILEHSMLYLFVYKCFLCWVCECVSSGDKSCNWWALQMEFASEIRRKRQEEARRLARSTSSAQRSTRTGSSAARALNFERTTSSTRQLQQPEEPTSSCTGRPASNFYGSSGFPACRYTRSL